jgi:hypothetical protein
MLSVRHVNTTQDLQQENMLSVRHVNTTQDLQQENMLSVRHVNTTQSLQQENKMFQNRVLRRIFGFKGESNGMRTIT